MSFAQVTRISQQACPQSRTHEENTDKHATNKNTRNISYNTPPCGAPAAPPLLPPLQRCTRFGPNATVMAALCCVAPRLYGGRRCRCLNIDNPAWLEVSRKLTTPRRHNALIQTQVGVVKARSRENGRRRSNKTGSGGRVEHPSRGRRQISRGRRHVFFYLINQQHLLLPLSQLCSALLTTHRRMRATLSPPVGSVSVLAPDFLQPRL